MKFKKYLRATVVAALCGVAAFAGCSTFEEEKLGSAQLPICQPGDPCGTGDPVCTETSNLLCVGGVYMVQPDECVLANTCTNYESACCTPALDLLSCQGDPTVGGPYAYTLNETNSPACACLNAGTVCVSTSPGLCAAGHNECQGSALVCVPDVAPGTVPETCDGTDEDCDGVIDNGDPGGGAACNTGNLGICADGVEHCLDTAIACVQTNQPTTETCNGLDDDCDGTVDQDGTCGPCWLGGPCGPPDSWSLGSQYCTDAVDGFLRCCGGVYIASSSSTMCPNPSDLDGDGYLSNADCNDNNAAVHPGALESCNNLDDNCDTYVDDGNPGGGAACNSGLPGICDPGTVMCLSGALSCVETIAVGTMPEVCDGLDNDCDGTADDGNPGGGASCSTELLGVCAAGTQTCTAGALSCVQNVASSAETCNGLDDDCDGTVDDGCLHSVRFVWTPPAGYVQTTANVLAIGDMWGVNVPGGYESHWHNGASVPSFCTMVQNSTFYECTVNIPGGGTDVCTNAFHEDATCGGSSYGIAAGGYLFDQNDHACGNCLGLGDGCLSPTEFGSWDVYVDGVLQAMTSATNGQLNTYNQCLANPIP